jgi:hypothetical protein
MTDLWTALMLEAMYVSTGSAARGVPRKVFVDRVCVALQFVLAPSASLVAH